MNVLDYRADFEEILTNYQLSSEAQHLLAKMRLVLLSGPSAAGRNTIIAQLLIKGHYRYIVSDTTRQPRLNDGIMEQNGINYWFREEAELLSDLKDGNFLEAEMIHNQQVSGISMRELYKAYQSEKVAITEVEIGGFQNICARKKDTIGIFVLPPSFAIWIERMQKRGEMSREEMIRRLKTGVRIFNEAITKEDSYIVVNDRLAETVAMVDAIVMNQTNKVLTEGKQIARELLVATEHYLESL